MIISERYAYLSGLIDGDGSMSLLARKNIPKSNRNKSQIYSMRLCIVNKNKKIMIWLRNNFGGRIDMRDMKKYNPNWSNIYVWMITGPKAKKLLIKCLPYLIIKRSRAKLAIEFQNTMIGTRRGQGKRLPKEIISLRQNLMLKMKKLNQKSGNLNSIVLKKK